MTFFEKRKKMFKKLFPTLFGGAQMQRQNQIFTRQYVLILINEILKNKNIDTEEESDADIDVRISLRNEFIRAGLTDKRIIKLRSEAMDDKQDLLVKQCDDYIKEREDDLCELHDRISGKATKN